MACFTLAISRCPAAVCFGVDLFFVGRLIGASSYPCISIRFGAAVVSDCACRLRKDWLSDSWRKRPAGILGWSRHGSSRSPSRLLVFLFTRWPSGPSLRRRSREPLDLLPGSLQGNPQDRPVRPPRELSARVSGSP